MLPMHEDAVVRPTIPYRPRPTYVPHHRSRTFPDLGHFSFGSTLVLPAQSTLLEREV